MQHITMTGLNGQNILQKKLECLAVCFVLHPLLRNLVVPNPYDYMHCGRFYSQYCENITGKVQQNV